jgi:lysozyme
MLPVLLLIAITSTSVAAAEPLRDGGTAATRAGPGAAAASRWIPGIDVSHWQGYVHWRRVATTRVRFVIAKATEGTGFVDRRYARNKRAAERHGLRFTAYHFARPGRQGGSVRRDARREADFFVETARLHARNLLPALDLERSGGLRPRALRRWTLTWLRRVEARLGAEPMVYSSPAFWARHLGNTRRVAREGHRVLWIAHYGTHRPQVPARGWDRSGWTIWQWTSRGRVDGIRGPVDRDFLRGRLGELVIREARRPR